MMSMWLFADGSAIAFLRIVTGVCALIGLVLTIVAVVQLTA